MRNYLSKVLYVLSGKRQQLLILLIVFVFVSLLEALGIGLIGPFLHIVANPKVVHEQPILHALASWLGLTTDNQVIIATGIVVMGIFCFKSLAYFLCKYYIYRFSYSQKSQLEQRLVYTYLHIPYIFHLSHNSASMIKNIIVEAHQFAVNCLIPLLEMAANWVVIMALLILLSYTDLSLLVVAMAVLLPTILLFTRLSRRVRRWGQRKSETLEEIICIINHALGGIKETKVIGCEQHFERELRYQTRENARVSTLVDSFQVLPKVSIETVLVIFLLIFIMVSQLISGRSLNDLTSVMGIFAVASIRLLPAASQILNSIGRMRESSYALDMLYLDLKEIEKYTVTSSQAIQVGARSLPLTPHDSPKHSGPCQFQHQITLNNVTYRYPGTSTAAIRDISFTIRKGESIALVGKSGSGKTTLVDILLGLLKPESGDIQLDGSSIYGDLRSWQNLLGYIPQSIFLTDDTIEHNIAFGVPHDEIDPHQLQVAIQAAQLEEFIASQPAGLQTEVGERGVKLSGGQRQRIGIARALYHSREILVLDEATSALDTETEKLVSDAINALAGRKTLIIIAHRFSTIERCDRIYQLDGGSLSQTGTYSQIILGKA